MQQRRRMQRRQKSTMSSKSLFRLRLLEPETAESDSPLRQTHEYTLAGNIGEVQIVSVPTTTSENAAQLLRQSLQEELKRPVVVVSHATQFVMLEKLTASETKLVRARIAAIQRAQKAEQVQ